MHVSIPDCNSDSGDSDGRDVLYLAMEVLNHLSKPETHGVALGARRLDVQRELSKVGNKGSMYDSRIDLGRCASTCVIYSRLTTNAPLLLVAAACAGPCSL